jgi:hypothetical protein
VKSVSEALEAWRQAVRDREATTPRTPEWLQAMMVEQDRRAAYQAATRDSGLDLSAYVDEPLEDMGELTADRSTPPPSSESIAEPPARDRRRRLSILRPARGE